MGVRNQAELEAARLQRAQHIRDVVVELEVAMLGPVFVNRPGDGLDVPGPDPPISSMIRSV